MSLVESFSYPVLSVEMLADTGLKLGPATAVLFDVGWRRYLVTNFHVVSGRHPFTDELEMPCRPEKLAVYYRTPSQEKYPTHCLAFEAEGVFLAGGEFFSTQ